MGCPSASRVRPHLAMALDCWGSIDLKKALRPAAQLAQRGFVVDETFQQQTAANAARFAAFTSTAELFLPGGAPPEPGSVLRNPDLGRTYTLLGKRGTDYLYEGRLGEEVVATVMQPPVVPGSTSTSGPASCACPTWTTTAPCARHPRSSATAGDGCRDGTAFLRRLDGR